MAWRTLAVLLVAFGVGACAGPPLRKVHTEHLGQLSSTALNPIDAIGITGTDLGVSFVEAGPEQRLIFLFGDSWTQDRRRWDQDSAAWMPLPAARSDTAAVGPRSVPRLHWFSAGGRFSGLRIPGPDGRDIPLGGMHVPMEGVAVDEVAINLPPPPGAVPPGGAPDGTPAGRRSATNYVFTTAGWNHPTQSYCCSVLAHTRGSRFDLDEPLVFDHQVATERFVNISAFVEDGWVWIFGSGPYRKSSVYLARVAPSQLHDRAAWQYFTGMDGRRPGFAFGEAGAVPVVPSTCVGELSVRPNPVLGYLMLYNCIVKDEEANQQELARGIYLHRASKPWGDWGERLNIFHPWQDRGYGTFMHRAATSGGTPYDDGLAEPGRHVNLSSPPDQCDPQAPCYDHGWRENHWGGEYGPYQIAPWFEERADGSLDLYYVMSSWAPYQSQLMRTTLARRFDPRPRPPSGADAAGARGSTMPTLRNPDFSEGLAGWTSSGDPFATSQGKDGRWRLTTYTAERQEAATGSLHQDFTVERGAQALRFRVSGGDAVVRLHRGDDIVRETRGRSGHAPRHEPDTLACWNIAPYRGERLRVAIHDGASGPWGFVAVTGFEFLDQPCERAMP